MNQIRELLRSMRGKPVHNVVRSLLSVWPSDRFPASPQAKIPVCFPRGVVQEWFFGIRRRQPYQPVVSLDFCHEEAVDCLQLMLMGAT